MFAPNPIDSSPSAHRPSRPIRRIAGRTAVGRRPAAGPGSVRSPIRRRRGPPRARRWVATGTESRRSGRILRRLASSPAFSVSFGRSSGCTRITFSLHQPTECESSHISLLMPLSGWGRLNVRTDLQERGHEPAESCRSHRACGRLREESVRNTRNRRVRDRHAPHIRAPNADSHVNLGKNPNLR